MSNNIDRRTLSEGLTLIASSICSNINTKYQNRTTQLMAMVRKKTANHQIPQSHNVCLSCLPHSKLQRWVKLDKNTQITCNTWHSRVLYIYLIINVYKRENAKNSIDRCLLFQIRIFVSEDFNHVAVRDASMFIRKHNLRRMNNGGYDYNEWITSDISLNSTFCYCLNSNYTTLILILLLRLRLLSFPDVSVHFTTLPCYPSQTHTFWFEYNEHYNQIPNNPK